jgi:hypothetical protein
MNMTDVTIIGLDIVRNPKVTNAGHTILAHFAAEIGVFTFRGCVLVRTARGGIGAWLPRLDDQRHHNNRSVTLHDESTRHAMLQAAREMYIRMGGTGAEYRSGFDDDDQAGTSETAADPTPGPRAVPVTHRTETSDDDRAGLTTFLAASNG